MFFVSLFKSFCRWMPKQAGVGALVEIIIKKDFVGPWPSWKKIPQDRCDRWFNAWKRKVIWPRTQDGPIRDRFNHVGSKALIWIAGLL
jgi:hypothetical protein